MAFVSVTLPSQSKFPVALVVQLVRGNAAFVDPAFCVFALQCAVKFQLYPLCIEEERRTERAGSYISLLELSPIRSELSKYCSFSH